MGVPIPIGPGEPESLYDVHQCLFEDVPFAPPYHVGRPKKVWADVLDWWETDGGHLFARPDGKICEYIFVAFTNEIEKIREIGLPHGTVEIHNGEDYEATGLAPVVDMDMKPIRVEKYRSIDAE